MPRIFLKLTNSVQINLLHTWTLVDAPLDGFNRLPQ